MQDTLLICIGYLDGILSGRDSPAQLKKLYVQPPCPISQATGNTINLGYIHLLEMLLQLEKKKSKIMANQQKLIFLWGKKKKKKTTLITKVSWEGFTNVFAPRSRNLLLKLAEMTSTFDTLQILMTEFFRRKQMILKTKVTETK